MSAKSEDTEPTKRPYQSPELRIYGDIEKVTQIGGTMGGTGDIVSGHDTKTGL